MGNIKKLQTKENTLPTTWTEFCFQGIFLWASDRAALRSRYFLHPLILLQERALTGAGTKMQNLQLLQWHIITNPKAYLQTHWNYSYHLSQNQNHQRWLLDRIRNNFKHKFEYKTWAGIGLYTHHVPPISQEHQHKLRSNARNPAEKSSSQSAKSRLSDTEKPCNERKTTTPQQLYSLNTQSPNRKPKQQNTNTQMRNSQNPTFVCSSKPLIWEKTWPWELWSTSEIGPCPKP